MSVLSLYLFLFIKIAGLLLTQLHILHVLRKDEFFSSLELTLTLYMGGLFPKEHGKILE